MPERRTSASRNTAVDRTGGFTAEERAAMRERAQELKAARRLEKDPQEAERAVLAKIAELAQPDRAMAERLHSLVRTHAPSLSPRLWYGMPAYARDGHVLCFLQPGGKFKARYATLGFTDRAHLDEGTMWPTTFALTQLGAEEEARIVSLLRKALG
ncbi:MAG: hypothetical protein K6V73_03725 [Firmicutes bacterium]|nr:hypothetical protein [Bacillota bacterium]